MKILLLIATALWLAVSLPESSSVPIKTGDIHPIHPQLTDPNVLIAVGFINDYFRTHNDTRVRSAKKIISATAQVVAGFSYTYTIELSGGNLGEVCSLEVWSRLWLPNPETNMLSGNVTCNDKINASR